MNNEEKYIENYEWYNYHKNCTCIAERYYDVWNRNNVDLLTHDEIANWHYGLRNIQNIISEAEINNKRIRCVGGRWSLSEVAMNENHFMVNTKPLDIAFIGFESKHLESSLEKENYVLAQCGVSISQLNRWLFQYNLALPTSGASDGQTIIGAISTGTHGSAIHVGSIQDFVLGMHILVSSTESYWIEGNEKILSDDAVCNFCGEVAHRINDNTIFNSALVSFGNFGVIFSVLLKCEPLYQLKLFQKYFNLIEIDTCITNPNNLSTIGWEDNPHHFELIVNPYKINQIIARVMYKMPYIRVKEAIADILYSFGIDLIALIGEVADEIPHSIDNIMIFLDKLLKKQYEEIPNGKIDFPGNIFTGEVESLSGKGMSIELGIDVNDAKRALDIILEVARQEALPGVISFRYVKKSKALLSMAQFPTTCAIEIPAAFSLQTKKFYSILWNELDKRNINYTLHWGQISDLNYEKIIRKWGIVNVQQWKTSRNVLLKTDLQREMFSNQFLIKCGLNN